MAKSLKLIKCYTKNIIRTIKIMNSSKIFCIGLHKTGTSSLHKIAEHHGLKSHHSSKWQNDLNKINQYDFLCDGGSHYDNQNEIDFEFLRMNFKNSKFIINIRPLKPWIISKLKHAGWASDTILEKGKTTYLHDEWRIKSKKNIELFIEHYLNRYIKIFTYFLCKTNEAYYVDICSNDTSHLKFLFGEAIHIFHENKQQDNQQLPPLVLNFIDSYITNRQDKVNHLNTLTEKFKNLKI